MRFIQLFGLAAIAFMVFAYLHRHSPSEGRRLPATAVSKSDMLPHLPYRNPFFTGTASTANSTPTNTPANTVNDLSYNASSFKGALLPERLTAMSARRNGRAIDPAQVAAALQSDVAWEADPTAADQLPLSETERKDGREFVRVNPMKIEALMAGDEMTLPISKVKTDTPMRMVVDQVEEGIGGNVTWHGHLKNFDKENQVSLTRGDSLIVGGVSTPDKNYVVQIHGNVGWIVDGFTLFKGRHDAIKPE